jgi:general stress protein YciG
MNLDRLPTTTEQEMELRIATLRGLDDLYTAFRARAEAINVSRKQIDILAGFTDGYASKALSPRPSKRLSVDSVFSMAAALGCELALVESPEAMEQISRRGFTRNANLAKHAGTVHFIFSKRHMRSIQRKGGKNSRANLSPEQASELGRKAAQARWGAR